MSRVSRVAASHAPTGDSSRFCYGHCGDRCYHGAPLTFWIMIDPASLEAKEPQRADAGADAIVRAP
jgi:hypothetical protein